MTTMASQITSLTVVYSIVYSGTDHRKHQSSASLAFVWGIHRGPGNSPHKGPVTRKMFPFDDVIMPSKQYRRKPQERLFRHNEIKHSKRVNISAVINCRDLYFLKRWFHSLGSDQCQEIIYNANGKWSVSSKQFIELRFNLIMVLEGCWHQYLNIVEFKNVTYGFVLSFHFRRDWDLWIAVICSQALSIISLIIKSSCAYISSVIIYVVWCQYEIYVCILTTIIHYSFL